MKRRNDDWGTLGTKGRVFLVVFGVAALIPGAMALLRGGHGYIDPRGLVVFAPPMILIGVFLIVIAMTPVRTK